MTFRVGIVAHTARFANAEALSRTTDADFVNYDTGVRGCEGNHRDALERLHRNARGAQWLVILEDDAVPVTGFRDQLDAALITAPAPIVSLYLVAPGLPSGSLGSPTRSRRQTPTTPAGSSAGTCFTPSATPSGPSWPRVSSAMSRICLSTRASRCGPDTRATKWPTPGHLWSSTKTARHSSVTATASLGPRDASHTARAPGRPGPATVSPCS
ncbi:bacteriophage protein [Mycolicibacterium conceptionense]|uniref:Bacteriophage protein n=1 Tax=Mycolicibacterium conceptionense TaxID=451644 RepID=A0A0U1D304_9MYCO|nr:bacteriophage protein [Mycolicibacterium conceptionense]